MAVAAQQLPGFRQGDDDPRQLHEAARKGLFVNPTGTGGAGELFANPSKPASRPATTETTSSRKPVCP